MIDSSMPRLPSSLSRETRAGAERYALLSTLSEINLSQVLMELEKCFVFEYTDGPPIKKRKVQSSSLETSLELRKDTYRNSWTKQEHDIQQLVRGTNAETLNQIEEFVSVGRFDHDRTRVQAGFLLNDPGAASSSALLEQIKDRLSANPSNVITSIAAANSPNLKTLLKTLIQRSTEIQADSDEEDERPDSRRKGRKLLNYDLQILHDWCKSNEVEKVIVIFEDTEAFDINVLTEAWILMHSWFDRIPFTLLCCIATPLQLFQERLPRAASRCIQGQIFDVPKTENVVERVFDSCISSDEAIIRLGPSLCNMLIQRSQEFGQGVDEFTKALKYAYMCHFYANPLSIFLHDKIQFKNISAAHFEALRNMPSFRSHCEQILQYSTTKVQKLLDSNQTLFIEVVEHIKKGKNQIISLIGALRIVQVIQSVVSTKNPLPLSTLYAKALSGELITSSPLIRELLLSVKKASSDGSRDILVRLQSSLTSSMPRNEAMFHDTIIELQKTLDKLIQSSDSVQGSEKRDHVSRSDSYKTTVVGQKVELKKNKPATSNQQSPYSSLVSQLQTLLEDMFTQTLIPMKEIFLHEILFYDLKSPHRDVFMPRPRFAIERALSNPHDYLGCNCCADNQGGLAPTQPATAILYQLYLESGALINAFDLWSAFNAILDDQEEETQTTMALFFRSLAELKHMGMIRSSRKKVDHLTKLQWKGL